MNLPKYLIYFENDSLMPQVYLLKTLNWFPNIFIVSNQLEDNVQSMAVSYQFLSFKMNEISEILILSIWSFYYLLPDVSTTLSAHFEIHINMWML